MTMNYTPQADLAVQTYILPNGLLSSSSLSGEQTPASGAPTPSNLVAAAKVTAGAFVITTATMGASVYAGQNQIWAPVIKESVSAVPIQAGGWTLKDSAELAILQHRYQTLASAVDHLGTLDDDDSHYLDSETIISSKDFIEFLEAFHVPAPRIFPHGGDALVFEWPRSDGVRYVTYDEGIARLRDYGDGAEYIDPVKFDLRQEDEIAGLIQALGGKQWRVKQASSSI